MIDKKIIKEVSAKYGLPESTAGDVVRDYIKKKDRLSQKFKNSKIDTAESFHAFIINSINEIVNQILQGKIPDQLNLPVTVKDKSLLDFTTNFNNGLNIYRIVTEYIEKLASGNLDTIPPEGNTVMMAALYKLQNELKQLVNTAEYMTDGGITSQFSNINSLSAAFNFIAVQLQKSFDKINSQKRELEQANDALIMANTIEARDMDMAVTVQRSLMPDSPPHSNRWDIAYIFKPMAGVSGDFYDFYMSNDELSGISLFDVSGHGISSALISMIAKWIIYQSFHKHFNTSFTHVPLEISRDLNAAIGKSDYYLTGVLIKFAGDTIKYINASHPDVYIKRDAAVFPLRKPTGEQPAGMLFGMNIEPVLYDELSYTMESGDFLLLYTDGLSECCNSYGEDFGAVRLQKTFSESPPSATAIDTLNFLIEKIYKFTGKNSFNDDCTVIVVKKVR